MSAFILAAGTVLCFEGLVFALAPKYLDYMVKTLASLNERDRRMAGLGALFVGVLLVWLSKQFGV